MGWWPTALERRIAVRYLRGQRGTRSASLQTAISIGGIAVGVAALLVVIGVMNGLRNDLRDRILVASPHLRLLTYGANLRVDDWRARMTDLRSDPDVVAVAPEVNSQTIVQNAAGYTEGVKVLGVEPGGAHGVIRLDSAVTHGDLQFRPASADADAGVVLGRGLADMLSVLPGDLLRAVAPGSATTRSLGGPPVLQWWTLEVTGIFETGMYIYDNAFLVMDVTKAQAFAGLDSAVSGVSVRLADPWRAPAVKARLAERLPPNYRIETWQEQNAALFTALELEKKGMALAIFIIMVVAAFNIVGTLAMVVAFKTREIGILLAMGLTPRGVSRIFLAQGAIIGMVGTALGLVLGLALSFAIDHWRLIRIAESVYFISHLPVRTEPLDVLAVVVASLLVAVLATLPPARRATQLTPVDAIRAE